MQNETENDTSLKFVLKKTPSKIIINSSNILVDSEPLEANNFDSLVAQQYIQYQIHKDPKDYTAIYNLPNGILNSVWKFEHVKQFNYELKFFFQELKNVCTYLECPKMNVNQSIFLCSAHGNLLRDCCAIDYFKHTLDWMDVIFHENNFKSFMAFHSEFELLESIADKFLKIFWHSYFHHNNLFHKLEDKTLLCSRFIYFGTKYNFIYEDFPKFDNTKESLFLTPTKTLSDDKSEDSICLEESETSLTELTAVLSETTYNKFINTNTDEFTAHPNNEVVSDINKSEHIDTAKSYHNGSDDGINVEETGSLISIEDGLLTHRTDSTDEDCVSGKLKQSPIMESIYFKKGKYHPELSALSDIEKILERTSEANFENWLDNVKTDGSNGD